MLAANRDINDLTPETAALCRSFLAAAKRAGLDVFVTETRRSFERQRALYALGRTQPGRIVTYSKAGTGKHEDGTAFDVAFHGDELYPKDTEKWARLGSIAESLGLTWGGRFKGVDSVHFENNRRVVVMGDDEKGVVVDAAKVAPVAPVQKLPTLKSATVGAVVTVLLTALPTIAMFVPAVQPFVGAINAIAKLFGYGV